MLIKAVELTLFPAVMAFAASSDLFTMAIANRVSIILVAVFGLLALYRDGRIGSAVACWGGGGGAGRGLRILCFRLDRRWRRQTRSRDGALVRFRPPGRLFVLRFAVRRRADARMIYFRGMPLPQVFVGLPWAERLHRSDSGVPYGIALAAAALVVYPHTQWMAAIGR